MAVIYLKHPNHGTKVAIDEQEANYDCTNGWIRYNVDTPLTPIEAAPVDDIRQRWEDKFGKKPHHKKTVETLRMELGE